MATLNIGQKISGGAVFNRTTGGSGTVFTTGPNEYARVFFQLNSISGASASISIGGVVTYISSGGGVLQGECLVPPSTAFSSNLTFAGGQYARGSYVLIANTQ